MFLFYFVVVNRMCLGEIYLVRSTVTLSASCCVEKSATATRLAKLCVCVNKR